MWRHSQSESSYTPFDDPFRLILLIIRLGSSLLCRIASEPELMSIDRFSHLMFAM